MNVRRSKARFVLSVCAAMGCLLLSSHAVAERGVCSPAGPDKTLSPAGEVQLYEELGKCVGTPYRRGGATKKGMDCSGFVKYMYAKLFGIDLPHKASTQFSLNGLRNVSRDDLQTGDLVFFQRNRVINHVGIYLSGGEFAHSVGGRGVVVSRLDSPYWQKRIAGSRRLPGVAGLGPRESVEADNMVSLHFDESNRLRLRLSTVLPAQDPGSGFGGDPFRAEAPWEEGRSWSDFPFSMELGYERRLGGERVNLRLSFLWERLLAQGAEVGDGMAYRLWAGTLDTAGTVPWTQGGLRLAGDIDPLQGLRITPSFTYWGTPSDEGNVEVQRGVLGVEARAGHPAWPYALLVSIRYAGVVNPALDSAVRTVGPDALSMSVAFHYRLKDMLNLSLAGTHGLGEPFPSALLSRAGARPFDDLLFRFDLSY